MPENLLIPDVNFKFKNNYFTRGTTEKTSVNHGISQEKDISRETEIRKIKTAIFEFREVDSPTKERANSPEVIQTFSHLAKINNEPLPDDMV